MDRISLEPIIAFDFCEIREVIDKTLHEVRPLRHQIAARLDQHRIAVKTLVGEEEDLWPKMSLLLDRVGL